MIGTSLLHHAIIEHFIEHGHAPSIASLAVLLDQPREAITAALHALRDEHGVVLHPASSEIWVCHPFSSAPTNFWVRDKTRGWWGNCAWCSLGIVALLGTDASITTTLGGESKQITVDIVDGVVSPANLLVHFPCGPRISRLSHRVVRHAPAPRLVAQESRCHDRGLASLAGRRRTYGVLTSRCTGQALTGVDVSAWRERFGSSKFSPIEPALAGELCVR